MNRNNTATIMLLVNLDTEDRLNLWAECETTWAIDPDTNAVEHLISVENVCLMVKFPPCPGEPTWEYFSPPGRISDFWRTVAEDACKDEGEQAQELHGPVVVEIAALSAAQRNSGIY